MTDKILTANRLSDGIVLFLGPDGRWVEQAADARVAREEAGWAALEEAGRAAVAAHTVVDPYLIETAPDADGRPAPTRYRERLRALGPSTHPHLGKQAEAAASPKSRKAA